jgi:hypothetical protein
MNDATVCVKTPKGIEEVARRIHNLSLRERRLLIMIDGSRNCASLAAMISGEDVAATIKKLLAEGFITPLVVGEPEAAKAPAIDEAKRFDMARNFMLNTVSAFLGVFGSGLSEKLEAADSLQALRDLYQSWRDAIRLTPEGQKRGAELEEKLAALLS